MTEKAGKFNSKIQLKKFKKHFLLGSGVIVLIILALSFISKPDEEVVVEKHTASSTFSAVKQFAASPAEVATQRMDQFSTEQQRINEQMQKKLNEMEAENAKRALAESEAESKAFEMNQKLQMLNNTKVSSSGAVSKVEVKPQLTVFEDDINSDTGNATDDGFENTAKKSAQNMQSEKKEDKAEVKSIATYIPSNTFVKGIVIGSLSANTGGNASSEPTPVLIRLTDLAQLPNEFKSNLRSCMVGGGGWGDLSTERIKIRLTTLSCVLKSGKALDIPVEGYIQGEDSKAGLAGIVVTHSGTIAAKATLAGFVQGVGQIGQAMGQTQTVTPLGGITTTISPSQAVTAGMGSGISQAGSTLSQYYLNMLQQISPSIEAAAGRHVTVVFLKGIELQLPINNQDGQDVAPLPLS